MREKLYAVQATYSQIALSVKCAGAEPKYGIHGLNLTKVHISWMEEQLKGVRG